MSVADEKYVTRVGLVELVNKELGIPLSLSVLNKDACQGRGPKVAARYGNKDLYLPEEGLRYARSRIKRTTEGAAA